MRAAVLALLMLCAPAHAEYRDDRSSPQAVIASLYNAVSQGDYARAWSYFASASKPATSYGLFASGYEATRSVRVISGTASEDAAMSQLYSAVPVAIEATGRDGSVSVFAGCYLTRQFAAGVQDPPFRGIEIIGGRLVPARGPIERALPARCDPDKVRRY